MRKETTRFCNLTEFDKNELPDFAELEFVQVTNPS